MSVFRGFDEFHLISPVVKAPTLVSDGMVLIDSTLILEYAKALARPHSLLPVELVELKRELRIIGLALAACEKSVQIVYEHNLRPAEKLHGPWITRVAGQLFSAYQALEAEIQRKSLSSQSSAISQAGVSVAVA